MGFIVLAGARAAQAGASAEEVVERIRTTREHLKMWFAVDTLEYLRRGGRIGAASAWLGSALKIKPILTLEQEITPIERVRTGAKALRRLVEYAEQRHVDGADAWVVQHIQAPDEAAQLVEEVEKIMGRPPLFVSEVGPVLGTHVGPGLLGVGGVPPSDRRSSALAAAATERGEAAAHDEPEHGGAGDRGGAVLVDLAAPVGEHLDLGAQLLDRGRQLAPSALDRAAGSLRASESAWLRSCLLGRCDVASQVPGARSPPSCASPPRSPCRASAARRP